MGKIEVQQTKVEETLGQHDARLGKLEAQMACLACARRPPQRREPHWGSLLLQGGDAAHDACTEGAAKDTPPLLSLRLDLALACAKAVFFAQA